MASQIDDTDFIDREYQQSHQTTVANEPEPQADPQPELHVELGAEIKQAKPELELEPEPVSSTLAAPTGPLPTREELEAKVGDTQVKLSQLKRQQEQLEQQRVALEETRRRRKEFHDGKAEMQQHLTRGIALLEEAELALRRDSTQMAKSLEAFREGLEKLGTFSEEKWTADNVETELTRALTTIENARMEWNSARLKWSFLDGEGGIPQSGGQSPASSSGMPSLSELSFQELCRLGFALTWPLAAVGLIGVGLLALRLF